MTDRYLRAPEVLKIAGGVSRMTIYRWERAGVFPRRRRLSGGMVAWLESEVEQWVQDRETASPADRDEA